MLIDTEAQNLIHRNKDSKQETIIHVQMTCEVRKMCPGLTL